MNTSERHHLSRSDLFIVSIYIAGFEHVFVSWDITCKFFELSDFISRKLSMTLAILMESF